VEAAAVDGRIEIALPDGTVIRVGEEVGLAALRRVVAALRA
jgi:transposase